jgi:hypothetical protein
MMTGVTMVRSVWFVSLVLAGTMAACGGEMQSEEESSAEGALKGKPQPDMAQPPPPPSAYHHCELVDGLQTGNCVLNTSTCPVGQLPDHCGGLPPVHECQAGVSAAVYSHSDCSSVTVSVNTCYQGLCL